MHHHLGLCGKSFYKKHAKRDTFSFQLHEDNSFSLLLPDFKFKTLLKTIDQEFIK